jgi:hypothetical protein
MHVPTEEIVRAYESLTPEEIAEARAKIKPDTPPVIFPCGGSGQPACKPENA